MNAILQCLFHSPRIVQILLNSPTANDNKIITSTKKLISHYYNSANYSPIEFYNAFVEKYQEFDNQNHHDPIEFFTIFINLLIDNGFDDLDNLLKIDIEISNTCNQCHDTTVSNDQQIYLTTPIPEEGCQSLYESLDNYSKPFNVENVCSECKRNGEVERMYRIKTLPDILVVHLERTIYISPTKTKKSIAKINFPTELECSSANNETQNYHLYASIDHLGNSTNVGHYVANIKIFSEMNKWYKISDKNIKIIDETELVTSDTYALFYYNENILPNINDFNLNIKLESDKNNECDDMSEFNDMIQPSWMNHSNYISNKQLRGFTQKIRNQKYFKTPKSAKCLYFPPARLSDFRWYTISLLKTFVKDNKYANSCYHNIIKFGLLKYAKNLISNPVYLPSTICFNSLLYDNECKHFTVLRTHCLWKYNTVSLFVTFRLIENLYSIADSEIKYNIRSSFYEIKSQIQKMLNENPCFEQYFQKVDDESLAKTIKGCIKRITTHTEIPEYMIGAYPLPRMAIHGTCTISKDNRITNSIFNSTTTLNESHMFQHKIESNADVMLVVEAHAGKCLIDAWLNYRKNNEGFNILFFSVNGNCDTTTILFLKAFESQIQKPILNLTDLDSSGILNHIKLLMSNKSTIFLEDVGRLPNIKFLGLTAHDITTIQNLCVDYNSLHNKTINFSVDEILPTNDIIALTKLLDEQWLKDFPELKDHIFCTIKTTKRMHISQIPVEVFPQFIINKINEILPSTTSNVYTDFYPYIFLADTEDFGDFVDDAIALDEQ